jgi:alanine-glyoxylate transaminase/serine-glyoxylate transaminase/serine-pyruvate transaminase
MAQPLLGHLDPEFLQIMDETQEMLRQVMRTENELTLPISGTGSAGMETCLCNLIEPDDPVLICINGVFGERMAEIAERQGAEVHTVEAEWGQIIQPDQVAEALKRFNAKLVCIVHAETSTGVLQPIEEISRIVHESEALLLVDAVTSLGGSPVETDTWGIDAIYSGTQKCLSCPPGLAPVSFSPRSVKKIESRRTKIKSWYLDMSLIKKYWGEERFYHHTAPVSMIFALNEALRLIIEEGLEERFARHRLNHRALVEGLETMGLEMLVAPEYRLPMLNAVKIPEGVDDRAVRGALLGRYRMEIGGGLGPLAGKIWRIGLMGYSSTRENVFLLLEALGDILGRPSSEAIDAASKVYSE